jgi:ATP-dependent Clp protease ATP-binding subunit ClpA
VFERFTDRARQVVVLAQDEARLLKHNYIGTEHLLLGLLREQEGVAARVLGSMNVTVENVHAQIVRIVGQGDEVTSGQIPFTPRAKKVLELSLKEALSLGHKYIGTEHILLAVTRETEGVGARVLVQFGADEPRVRDEVLESLGVRAPPPVKIAPSPRRHFSRGKPRRTYADRQARLRYLLVCWTLGALTLGIGILIGWAIWGT